MKNNDSLDKEILSSDQQQEVKQKKKGFFNSPYLLIALSIFGFARGVMALSRDESGNFYFVLAVLWLGLFVKETFSKK